MKQKFNNIYLLFIVVFIMGCQKDNIDNNSDYINAISLHLTYKELGTTIDYSSPPVVKMVNITEQIIRTYTANEKGEVVLDKLLPEIGRASCRERV